MIIGHMIIWDQAGADILLWSIVFHGLNHLVYSEVRGGVYTILRSIVVYCECFVGSTVGDYSVCSVWCVHFVFFVFSDMMYLLMLHTAVMRFACMSLYWVWCCRNAVLCCSSLVSFQIRKLHGTISAAQKLKSWVAQRATHGESLGRPYFSLSPVTFCCMR